MTIEEARRLVFASLDDGAICLCCGQMVAARPRRITWPLAKAVQMLARETKPGQAVPLQKWLLKMAPDVPSYCGGDPVKLRYWGFIARPSDVARRQDGSTRVGRWFLTQRGRAFADGDISVPRVAFVYNDEVLGFGLELVDMDAALAEGGFDFSERP